MMLDLASCMHRQCLICHKICCTKTTLQNVFGDFELAESVYTSKVIEYPKFAFGQDPNPLALQKL